MLCLNCGTPNTDLVSYCTKCGANLQAIRSALLTTPPPLAPPAALTSRLYMTVLVLSSLIAILGIPTVIGGVIAILSVARDAGLQPNDLAPIVVMMTLFGFAGVVLSIWLLLRSVNSRQIVDHSHAAHVPQSLPLAQGRPQIAPPSSYVSAPLVDRSEPVSSVTEHTTAHLQDYVAPPPGTPRRQ
jgi:hypothetical protein